MRPESTRTYLPAAGHDWSLPFYDPIVKLRVSNRQSPGHHGRSGVKRPDRMQSR